MEVVVSVGVMDDASAASRPERPCPLELTGPGPSE
jgi:hypothetical protein